MFDKVKCGLGIHKWSEWEYVSENSCNRIRSCLRCMLKETKEGEHIWDQWEYVSNNSCDCIRRCQRCAAIDKKEGDHTWGEWEYCIDSEKKEMQIKKDALLKVQDNVFNEYASAKDDKIKAKNKNEFDEIVEEIEKLELQIKQLEKTTEPCKQIRSCKNCPEKQFRVEHNLTSPEYASNNSCKIERICQNTGCNYKESLEDKHIWGPWQYASPNKCIQVRHCTRCPKSEYTSEEKHIWSEWQIGLVPLDPCKIARSCDHCKQIEKKNEYQHNWGEWVDCEVRKGNIVYNRQNTCSHCNKSTYGTEHKGIILTSSFYDHYIDIADYTVNFNPDYAKKHKKEIIRAIGNVAEFNNKVYPLLEISSLPGITQIIKMLKESSEEDIRIAAIKALITMRRPADNKSEEILTTIFKISITDSCKKVCILSKSYLEELNKNAQK